MSEIANTVRRFPMSLPSGLHTDEVADLIESQAAAIEMKDKRIDWTVTDNAKKAIEIERLTAENKQLRAVADAADKWHKEIGPIDGTMKAWIDIGLALNALALKETAE